MATENCHVALLYLARDAEDLHVHLDTVDTPLNALGNKELWPSGVSLEQINAGLR